MTTRQAERVRVKCDCGRKYRCRASLRGRTVKCRACGENLVVPNIEVQATAPKIDSELPLTTCPSCEAPRANGAEICVNCWYDFETKQSLDQQLTERAADREQEMESDRRAEVKPLKWATLIGGMLFVVLLIVQSSLDGKQFLACYSILIAFCWGGGEFLRSTYKSPLVLLIPALTILACGISRVVSGLQQGMHRFGFLIVFMIFGIVLTALGSRTLALRSGQVSPKVRFGWPVCFGVLSATVSLTGFAPRLIFPMLVLGTISVSRAILEVSYPAEPSTGYSYSGQSHREYWRNKGYKCSFSSGGSGCGSGSSCGGGGGCGGGGCGGGCGGCGG